MNVRALFQSDKGDQVRQIFDEIADRYDRTNAVLSLGMHYKWNRALCRVISHLAPNNLLDLCCGTGAIGLRLKNSCNTLTEIFLVDFSSKMLSIAKKRHAQGVQNLHAEVNFVETDVLDLPDSLKKRRFDAISMAYGLRNLLSPQRAFQQAFEILNPGGVFAILELTRPTSSWLRHLHQTYLNFLPIIGLCMTQNAGAYRYLSQSIRNFADAQTLQAMALQAGFKDVRIHSMQFGIASLIVCTKEL